MCGHAENTIVKVVVREALQGEVPTHWAWWDNKDGEFMFICSNILGVKICFPYGPEVEEEAGNGKIYGVIVEEEQ